MSWELVQIEEKVETSGCENHAEPPKPSQGHQRQEDQLRMSVCGCFVCAHRPTAGGKRCSERMTDRPLPV